MSLVGFGSAIELRWLAISVLGTAMLFGGGPQLAWNLAKLIDSSGKRGIAFHATTMTMLVLLFAKTAVSTDYDSMWYGLIGNRVLVGEGSLFASQGLVAVVHYYPKLYEALLIPLSGIGSISVISGFGIVSWTLTLATVYLITQEMGLRRRWRPQFIALVATLPALANVSITTKGDAFATWLVCAAIYSMLKFKTTESPRWFWLCICSALLGTQARLSSIPYALTVLVILGAYFYKVVRRDGKGGIRKFVVSKSAAIAVASLLLVLLVTLRTYVLAGVPIIAPDSFVKVAERFGLHVKFPAGRLALPNWQHLPVGISLFSYLFNPSRYIHVELYWTGNFWLFVPILALMKGVRSEPLFGRVWPIALIGALFFIVLFGFRFDQFAGGDGNYFIIPVICLAALGAVLLQGAHKGVLHQDLQSGLLLLFAVSSAVICLVTGMWGPGTRAFDLVMNRNPLDYTSRQSIELKSVNLAGVASFFRNLPSDSRVIGVAPAPDAWWLPVRYEPVDIISWSRPGLVKSTNDILDFIARDSIRYIILRSQHAPAKLTTLDSSVLTAAVIEMDHRKLVTRVYSDEYYEVWMVSAQATNDVATLVDGSYLRLDPLGNPACDVAAPFEVKVDWSVKAPHHDSVKIYVQSRSGHSEQLWSQTAATGSQLSGRWVLPGSKFIVRDVSNGELILSDTVMPQCTFDE